MTDLPKTLAGEDAGETSLKIAALEGHVILAFPHPVKWIGLHPSDAEAIANGILSKVEEARKQPQGDLKAVRQGPLP